jgi:S1-C subfamily serine protease
MLDDMTETGRTPNPPFTPVTPMGPTTQGTTAPRARHRRTAVATVGAFGVAAGAVFGVHQAMQPTTVVGQASPAVGSTQPATFVPNYGRGPFGGYPYGSYPYGSDGSSSGTYGGTATGSSSDTLTAATAAQQVGIVEIDTVLQYQGAQAAGTGMVLTSDGEILTNNHVVEGATSITVTISSTGATYAASVVGTDPTDDVAVLQLADASGLPTAHLSDAGATVGESVTGVGNAGGTGTLTAAPGTVTALEQSITASDETGADSEQLSGLIETDAAIQAGDSGGPLYGEDGMVIGMDTAASTGGATQAYAIPIDDAEAIAAQIVAGVDDSTIHQGLPAFLGVSLQGTAGGATVAGVVSGAPAADAGITAGDVITSVDGSAIGSADDLSSALATLDPGDHVTVTWTGIDGSQQTTTVTLAAGPAD